MRGVFESGSFVVRSSELHVGRVNWNAPSSWKSNSQISHIYVKLSVVKKFASYKKIIKMT